MKKLRALFLVIAAAAGLSACAVTGAYYYRADPFRPVYVYLYPDGCWADDLWYAPCPWIPGPHWGYYRYYDGYFYWQQQYYWGFRPGVPPPGYWRHHGDLFPHIPRFPARPPPHHPRHHRR